MSAYFITGTDTGVGKTWATLALMQAMQDQGKLVGGMKPVASGCTKTSVGLRNEDALKLLEQADHCPDYASVNPYALEDRVAPHIAAENSGVHIDLEKIAAEFTLLKQTYDIIFVEGIGGWSVPLAHNLMLADMVHRLALPVILVIGMRLGCINHALATVNAMQTDKITLQGWIASQLDADYSGYEATLTTLKTRIKAPFLGNVPYMKKFLVKTAASQLSFNG